MLENDPLIVERSSENIKFCVVTKDRLGDVENEGLRNLVAHWLDSKNNNDFVLRSDIDVLEWPHMIGWTVVYDYLIDEDNYLCRIFGENLLAQSGEDMTGKKLTEYPERLHLIVRKQYEGVRATNLPICVTYRARTVRSWRDNPEIEYGAPVEKVALPLSRSGSAVDCIMVSSREIG